MKPISFFIVILIIFSACKKENKENQPGDPVKSYVNTVAGSKWIYHEVNASTGTAVESDYSVTSLAKDTTIDTKKYHIYTYSYGGSKYLNQSNSDYYEYDSLNGYLGKSVERLYLKANLPLNGTWSQDVSVPVTMGITINVKLNNQIKEKGEKTVNGTTYSDVIHVKSTLTSTDIPADKLTSGIDSYFAPGYGMIENHTVIDVDYMGINNHVDIQTTLKSAILN